MVCAGTLHAQAGSRSRSELPRAGFAASDGKLAGEASGFRALMDGRVEEAAGLLQGTLAAAPADALAHQGMCRVFYAQDEANQAIRECEAAVSDDPRSSDDELWLGRAYGMKARHAGPIAGFTLARKVHAGFERAVELDPMNVAALRDLGEYYVNAPAVVGGGNDKARALAQRMMPRFPADAHWLLAMVAQDEKDLGTAESELKQAIAAQRTGETWINLAHFYEIHSRPDDALAAVRAGLAADRTHGPVLVDAASILTAAHRDPELAERCLQDYLASRAKSDAAPAFKVHLQLARLLAARGDTAAASRETACAAALAPGFLRGAHPAQGA